MHVGALVVFEGPAPSRDDFRAHLESRLRLVPRYRQKLAVPRLEMGRPFWVDDPSFNLDYHVRHTALPKPGSEEQLRHLVGRIFSQRLDRSKPLWELWVVQGLEDGRFALISKTHHALVDGVAGVDIATVLFDLSPVPAELPEDDGWTAAPEPSSADLVAEGVKGLLKTPFELAGKAIGAAEHPRRTLERRARGGRGARRGRLGRPQPGARRAAQRGHRPAPPRLVGREPARRLQGDQERARRHGQRRRAGGRGGRARALAARPRRAHGGTRAACARAGVDPLRRRARRARQPHRRDARAAAGLRRRPGRAPHAGARGRWAA